MKFNKFSENLSVSTTNTPPDHTELDLLVIGSGTEAGLTQWIFMSLSQLVRQSDSQTSLSYTVPLLSYLWSFCPFNTRPVLGLWNHFLTTWPGRLWPGYPFTILSFISYSSHFVSTFSWMSSEVVVVVTVVQKWTTWIQPIEEKSGCLQPPRAVLVVHTALTLNVEDMPLFICVSQRIYYTYLCNTTAV